MISSRYLKWIINWWPPFWGTGIKITHLSANYDYARVIIKQRRYNLNYFGTHYGGNLFSMTDPFFAIMIANRLGQKYFVWDQNAYIDYIKPGKGTLRAEFYVTDEMINEFKEHTENGDKYLPKLDINILNEADEIVAKLVRTIYIRKKKQIQVDTK